MIFFELTFLFLIGSTLGWTVELLFRRFFSAKKWINPGFLVGPYLPLYGFGLVGLYIIARISDSIPVNNPVLRSVLVIFIMAIVMTVIEYFAGLIFVKRMNIKLWDYSNRWGNIQGIICPLFSFFWLVISTFYYLFLYKFSLNLTNWISECRNLYVFFGVGIFYGIFFVDLAYSFQISKKISKIAKESKIVIKYEHLKESISEQLHELKQKSNFILAFKSSLSLVDQIKHYISSKFGNSNNRNKDDDLKNKE